MRGTSPEGAADSGQDGPPCPACLGRDLHDILQVTAGEAAGHFVLPSELPERHERLRAHIASLWGGDGCRMLRCAACGFGFADPFVAGDAAFYNLAFPHLDYPRTKWEFARTLDALAFHDTAGKTALEVGAGRGHFLDLVANRFFDPAAIAAIEYNEGALERLRAGGYRVFDADIRSETFAGLAEAFDFVFLFQVVEHMDGVDALFARLRRLLRPGGSAFIAVPNPVRTAYQEANGSLIDMPPNHIGRWTPAAFEAATRRTGLAVLKAEYEPFDALRFVRQDIPYALLRRAQIPGSLANRVRSLKRGPLRKAAQAAAAALLVPSRLPPWRRAFADRARMGGALWVQVGRG